VVTGVVVVVVAMVAVAPVVVVTSVVIVAEGMPVAEASRHRRDFPPQYRLRRLPPRYRLRRLNCPTPRPSGRAARRVTAGR